MISPFFRFGGFHETLILCIVISVKFNEFGADGKPCNVLTVIGADLKQRNLIALLMNNVLENISYLNSL